MFWRGLAATRMLIWGLLCALLLWIVITVDAARGWYGVVGVLGTGGFAVHYGFRAFSATSSVPRLRPGPAMPSAGSSFRSSPPAPSGLADGDRASNGAAAGWFPDPLRGDVSYQRRWWDGQRWTRRTDPEARPGQLLPDDLALEEAAGPVLRSTSGEAERRPAAPPHRPDATAGWFPDPLRGDVSYQRRWWDGQRWTRQTDPEARPGQLLPSESEFAELPPP
jgi:hypothetical protein